MEEITIKSVTNCPTCNSECKVNGGTTQYYVPVKKYTEEDIREAIDMARMLSHVACLEEGEHRLKYSNTEDDIINSLNKQDNE